MPIFFANNMVQWSHEKTITQLQETPRFLISFYYVWKKQVAQDKRLENYAAQYKKDKTMKTELFIDSGAFSAFTQNVQIDIQDYIRFIKEHKHLISLYANLDVIGDAEATWQNQKIMEDAGLDPLPCFHYGEPEKYLVRYLDKYDYVALGGVATKVKQGDVVSRWLDMVFGTYVCDASGMTKHKIHGFGITSLRLLLRYPWYSVDSTSWVVNSRMGALYVPVLRNGKWMYDDRPWKVNVSSRSPSVKDAGDICCHN